MKLMINYDFFNAVLNVNEPFGPFKIIRNEKVKYIIDAPLWYSIGSVICNDFKTNISSMCIAYCMVMAMDLSSKPIFGFDIYEYISSNNLKKLVPKLENINVKTNYNLLLESVLYDKQYKIQLNENKIPFLLENKYILVPSYSYNGEIIDTSILQEHEVGTKKYTLSVGSPERKYRTVMAHA